MLRGGWTNWSLTVTSYNPCVFNSVLRCYILDGREPTRIKWSYASVTQHQGKSPEDCIYGIHKWEEHLLQQRIIGDVDKVSEVLLIIFCSNFGVVEFILDRSGHTRKEVGEGESVTRGGAQTKGKVCESKLTKNVFFHSDLLQLCLEKLKITDFFPDKKGFLN